MALDIGIDAKTRKKVAGALEQVLADTYSLYAKTHGYHWNIEGPRFLTLHTLFETQYNELDSILSSNWNGTWPSWFSIPELYQGTNQFPGRKAHRLCAFRFFSSRDWSSSLIGVKDRINRKFGKSAIRLLGESTEQCRKMRTGNKSTNDYTPGFGSHCLSQNQIFMMKRFLRA